MSVQCVNSVFTVHNSKICPPKSTNAGQKKKKKKGENVNSRKRGRKTRSANAHYIDVCDSTLIGNFSPKHRSMSLSSSQLKLNEKLYKDNYAIDHNQ